MRARARVRKHERKGVKIVNKKKEEGEEINEKRGGKREKERHSVAPFVAARGRYERNDNNEDFLDSRSSHANSKRPD